MTAPSPAADVILAQYITAQGQLRSSLLSTLARMWAELSSWRDTDAATFAQRAVPLVQGAQQATATLTSSYLARMVSAMTDTALIPPAVSPAAHVGEAVRAVDPLEEYQRPFVQVWTELSKGSDLDAAVEAGGRRLQTLGATDLQLAKTHASRSTIADDHRVVGYRRVLTGDHSCGLCIVASTQRYHKADLMPIHPSCDCGVAPLMGNEDPGQVIDEASLAGAHAAVQARFGRHAADARSIDYRKVIIQHHHGEIGPVIAVKGQHFDKGPRRR